MFELAADGCRQRMMCVKLLHAGKTVHICIFCQQVQAVDGDARQRLAGPAAVTKLLDVKCCKGN